MEPHIEDKIFIDREGEVDEYTGHEKRWHVRFPVYLAVRHNSCVDIYNSFVLNISKGGLFIETSHPFHKGEEVILHLYIPPEDKLLGVFKGKVVAVNRDNPAYPRGVHVKLITNEREEMRKLEEFLEEKKHLLDAEV